MNYGNGRPLSKKKQVQLMVALTILAWATQTLRHQWGFGAEIDLSNIDSRRIDASPATAPSEDADDVIGAKETFVPRDDQFGSGATLELRAEATIVGSEIKLKQICRWSDQDASVFAPVADFVMARIKTGSAFGAVSIAQVKSTLHDAGINLAAINIVGASSCTISRSDAAYDEQSALQQWIDARQGAAASPSTQPDAWSQGPAEGVTVSTDGTSPAAAAPPAAATPAPATLASDTEEKQFHTLRELLTSDLATRTSLPIDQLQMSFRAEDEKVLSLSEPTFRFEIDPLRASNLGDVSWSVTILAGGEKHRVTIKAQARAWQQQVILTRPVDSRQVLQPEDYTQRRTLIDSLPNEPLLTTDQLSNEQAAENLKPGTVMTSRMVDAVPLVKSGQFVTITVRQGGVQISTVAQAMESGSYGQTIRVRNEETRDIFEVTMTGPQTATMDSAPSTAANAQ